MFIKVLRSSRAPCSSELPENDMRPLRASQKEKRTDNVFGLASTLWSYNCHVGSAIGKLISNMEIEMVVVVENAVTSFCVQS